MRRFILIISALWMCTTSAHAQTKPDERIDQLEEEVMLLKRQQERLRGTTAPSDASGKGNEVGNAQTSLRITSLEDEIRTLRGQVEEKDFAVRRLTDELEKFKRDAEFRLGELEKSSQPNPVTADTPDATQPDVTNETATPATNKTPPATKAEKPAAADDEKPVPAKDKKTDAAKVELSVKDAAPAPAEDADTAEDAAPTPPGDTPRDHYNFAFRLLNQNQYDEASKSFADFATKYPKDPLVGNAHYWQGETYYIRKDYGKAVDQFRQGFEAMPKGPKAADNLLKLGMSLAALEKKDEACVVLSQVMSKYKVAAASVANRAAAEHKRVKCE